MPDGSASAHLYRPKLVTTFLEGYSLEYFRKDVLAGLTVAIVALPLSMAIAVASGVSPERGLYTSIIGGFLVSALGGSRFQIGGPAGAFIVLVAATVARFGVDGLLLTVLLSGLMLMLVGILRLGLLTPGSGTQVFVTINARDAELHLTQSTAGNNVVTTQTFDPNTGLIEAQRAGPSDSVASFDYAFDTIGNLTSRADNVELFTEKFCYDSLNRLTNSNINAVCTGGKTISYDAIGNITVKSDTGTYHYAAVPHAVSSIDGTVDGLTNPKYTYDSDGSLTCISTGPGCTGTVGRQVTMTSFNMASVITQGSDDLELTYDDQHARVAQSSTVSSATTMTTYLNDPASGAISEMVIAGSGAEWNGFSWDGSPWSTTNITPVWTDYKAIAPCVVYEFDFDRQGSKTYQPSFLVS